MGVDSRIGRSVGRSVGRSGGRNIARVRKTCEYPSPPPIYFVTKIDNGHKSILTTTLDTKSSKIDFDSYFEHKIDPNYFALAKRFFLGGNKLCCFFTPQRGSIESFGFRFFCCWGAKLQRNRGMHQIPIRKRTFFTCSVHKFFKNS